MPESYIKLKEVLNSLRREFLKVRLLAGFVLLLALSFVMLLAGVSLAKWIVAVPVGREVYLLLWAVALLYCAYRYIYLPLRPFLSFASGQVMSEDNLALFVEGKRPDLKESLINSVQLGRDLLNPEKARFFSEDFVTELIADTVKRLEGFNPREIVSRQSLWSSLKGLILVSGVLCLYLAIKPGYFQDGLQSLRQGYSITLAAPGPPIIGDFVLTYRYPMYTGLEPRVVSGASGDLRALKGSQVEIVARSDKPISSASLLVNGVSRVPVKVDGNVLKGSLVLLESGGYCFESVLPSQKEPIQPLVEAATHSITIEEDGYPTVLLQAPQETKVVAEKDSVKIQYQAGDDFGLKEIRLVLEGKGITKSIEKLEADGTTAGVTARNKTAHGGSYDWDLAELRLRPGEKLAYHLEALDNDTVSGPKVGRSKTHYLEIYSAEKRHYELISLQDVLFKEMVQLLAEELVKTPRVAPSREELLLQQEVLRQKTLGVLSLFQKVLMDMEEDSLANYAVYYSLQNMQTRLSELLEEKGGKVTAVRKSFTDIFIGALQAHQEREIEELEGDILFLVELLRKEKLDDFMGMDRRVEDSQRTLTQLLEDLRQGKEGAEDGALKELERLEELISEMMQKLSQMSSHWMEEFINMDALKNLADVELAKELEEMRKAMESGDLSSALESALKALESLEKMLQQMGQSAQQYVDSAYSEALQKMQNLDKRLKELEERERSLAQTTENLKKDIQSRAQEKLEGGLEDFFQRQEKRMERLQEELAQLESHFDSHPELKDYSTLEKEVSQKLRERGQRGPWPFMPPGMQPLDREELEELSEKMAKLNKAKRKDPLLDTYNALSKALPQLKEKLSQQEEVLKGQDIKESLELSREGLRDLRYWDSEMERSSAMGFPNREAEEFNEETTEHLASSKKLQEEIVKELESLASAFEERSKALTQEESESFAELAQRQEELESQANHLGQSMENLSKGNPLMGKESNEHMKGAIGHMDKAAEELAREDGSQALTEERETLYELAQTRKELGKSMERLSKGMMAKGLPMPKYVMRYRDMWEDGDRGLSLEEVKIPTPEAYKVPKEFRQDILDAMKQGLPKKYQELNEDYYRKLVE